ncbi:hypothetical protein BDP55DRAFT_633071 [Colletotrichum godetiae]|uniref:Uncharacterized protein n=1 Tax=Colletotrichum godetiae TaxID=1209918 RepID=A0AAJ0AIQ4_9PEZI|nr:uncharacterized protein BDP55DRAFT_633071 [Colletotrichum godetiae]KAK1674637.1 hypothetical protein BDP55DRAFT_633071 [Colletotrichum godetiae]
MPLDGSSMAGWPLLTGLGPLKESRAVDPRGFGVRCKDSYWMNCCDSECGKHAEDKRRNAYYPVRKWNPAANAGQLVDYLQWRQAEGDEPAGEYMEWVVHECILGFTGLSSPGESCVEQVVLAYASGEASAGGQYRDVICSQRLVSALTGDILSAKIVLSVTFGPVETGDGSHKLFGEEVREQVCCPH